MVSIIIITWNNEKHIESCITSLLSAAKEKKCEIILIDNASQDKTIKIATKHPIIKIIENKENLGYTKSCNQGALTAQGNCVLFLNPDTNIAFGAIKTMEDYLNAHNDVGIVGPQMLNVNGTIQQSCRKFPFYLELIWDLFLLSYLFPGSKLFGGWRMTYFDHRLERSVDQVMGACLMIKKRLLLDVNCLDERFYMFFSDVDLCYKIKNLKKKVMFYPVARCHHSKGISINKVRMKMLFFSHIGFIQFLIKHKKSIFEIPLIFTCGLLLSIAILPRMLIHYIGGNSKSA